MKQINFYIYITIVKDVNVGVQHTVWVKYYERET